MSLPNYLAKIKSSGIYRFVFDKSEVAAVPAETLRLVVGYSEKGPFNTPTYIKNSTEFITTYGGINKKLERRGVYFHRMALQALTAGPILALNLKKFSTEKVDAISFAPNVPMYKSLPITEEQPYPIFKENIIELPIESVYNTTRFWVLEPDQLQKADKMDNYISLATTDSKDCSNTIFMRSAKVTGYDLTIKSWYSNMGEDMPSYFDGYENMILSDFWADIYVFKGKFTKELATSNALAPYFNVDKDGVVTLKRYVINAFGDKVDALTALAADDNANFIKMYTGCLLPNFKDAGNNYVSLDLLFNADNYLHKMMMDFNIEMLDNGDITVDTLSTAGHLMIDDKLMQSLVETLENKPGLYEYQKSSISMFSNVKIIPEISVASYINNNWDYKNSDFVTDPHLYIYKLNPNESLTEGVSADKYGKLGLIQGDRFMGLKEDEYGLISPAYATITNIKNKQLPAQYFITDLDKAIEIKDRVENPEKSNLTEVTANIEQKNLFTNQMFVAKFRPNIDNDDKEALKDKIFTITGKIDKPEGADIKVKYYVPEEKEIITKSMVDILKNRKFEDNIKIPAMPDILAGRKFTDKDKSTYIFSQDLQTCTMHFSQGNIIFNIGFLESEPAVTLTAKKDGSDPAAFEIYNKLGILTYTYEGDGIENIILNLKSPEASTYVPAQIILTAEKSYIAGKSTYEFGPDATTCKMSLQDGAKSIMMNCEIDEVGKIVTLNPQSKYYYTPEGGVIYTYTYTWNQSPEKEELILIRTTNLPTEDPHKQDFDKGWPEIIKLINTDGGIDNPTTETIISYAQWADLNIAEDGSYTTGLQIPSDILLDPTNDGISTLQIICNTPGKYSTTFDYVNIEDLETPVIKLDTPLNIILDNSNILIYTFDNPINTYGNKFIVRCNSSIACDISTMRPIYMKGYTFASEKPKTMRMKDKLDWQENIMSAITDYPGLRTALTNRTDVDYRYIVDTFEAYVASEVHSKLSIIAKEKDNALAFLNFPAVKTFIDCDYTSFTDERNRFNAKYIKDGGNKLKSPAVLFSLASEANGASFASYNTPVTFSDGTIKTFVPSAALVSNNFMVKYTSRQPYYIVAGPNYGRIIYNGMVGPDYNYSRADLDILEPMGVNVMVYVPRKGTYINSNQTAKQNPVTALSKINIRELVIYLQDEIEKLLQNYQWEFNTQTLRDTVKAKADVICENIKANGGLYAYVNVCDTTNNTNDVIDNEMFVLSTEIEPSKGAGKMVQELTIHKTGGLTSTIK